MKRVLTIVFFIFICSVFCFSQEVFQASSDDDSFDYNYAVDDYGITSEGDQNIRVGLKGEFALFPRNLNWGGSAELGYHRFISSTMSIGADINFDYMRTKGSNVFYCVPIMGTCTLLTSVGRFEIPISVSAGAALESYLNQITFQPIVKPQVGVFYRYSADWSIGVSAGAAVMPEIYIKYPEQNRTATTVNAGLVVKYHF